MNEEGNRLSQNSSLSILITQPFNIKINDILYQVKIPDDLGNFYLYALELKILNIVKRKLKKKLSNPSKSYIPDSQFV